MSGRYAIKTSVSVDRTRAEIESTLRQYGSTGFAYGWSDRQARIEFVAHGKRIRFDLTLPDPKDKRFFRSPRGRSHRTPEQAAKEWEQACRSHWRALALAIKAKLESVAIGISQFEQEFFAFIVDPITNHTLYETVRPALEARYEGRDTPLLGLPAPSEPPNA